MSAMPDAKCSTLRQEVVVAATLESPEPTFPFFMDFQLLFVSEKDPFLGSSKRLALFYKIALRCLLVKNRPWNTRLYELPLFEIKIQYHL